MAIYFVYSTRFICYKNCFTPCKTDIGLLIHLPKHHHFLHCNFFRLKYLNICFVKLKYNTFYYALITTSLNLHRSVEILILN